MVVMVVRGEDQTFIVSAEGRVHILGYVMWRAGIEDSVSRRYNLVVMVMAVLLLLRQAVQWHLNISSIIVLPPPLFCRGSEGGNLRYRRHGWDVCVCLRDYYCCSLGLQQKFGWMS